MQLTLSTWFAAIAVIGAVLAAPGEIQFFIYVACLTGAPLLIPLVCYFLPPWISWAALVASLTGILTSMIGVFAGPDPVLSAGLLGCPSAWCLLGALMAVGDARGRTRFDVIRK